MPKKKLTRREFLSYSALSLSLLYVAGCGSVYASNLLETTHSSINTGKLSKPLKLIHFSDLHLCKNLSFKLLNQTINNIKELKPDIICFTGDVISTGKGYTEQISETFSQFNPDLGIYAILGNHDYADHWHSQLVQKEFGNAGVNLLINNSIKINHNNKIINISGLDDLWRGKQDFNKTFNSSNKKDLNICLTHNPSNVEEISKHKPDIILAGHTHGGQVYIPSVLDYFYKSKFDPRFIRGIYKVNDSILNVNRGIGATVVNLLINNKHYQVPARRLFSSPEISVITIT